MEWAQPEAISNPESAAPSKIDFLRHVDDLLILKFSKYR